MTDHLTARLPRDGKGKPITIGDRVIYVQFGVSMNGKFPDGYTPLVACCDVLVGGVTETTILPHGALSKPLLSRDCYLDIGDAFRVMKAQMDAVGVVNQKLEVTA